MASLNAIVEELKEKERKLGSRAKVAEELGTSDVTLCQVIRGHRKPSKELLERMGYEAVVSYEKITP